MNEESDIRWGLSQRFEFIEWRAYWDGRVNRKDLEEEFKISTQQASADLGKYQAAAPENIEYDSTEKTYVATGNFRPRFLRLSPERYLLQLQALRTEAIRKSDTWFDELPNVDVTPGMTRSPEAYTLRAVVKAIRMRGEIEINYQSLSRTGMRKIRPHALASDGYRWHTRALSVEHGEYRDYVLGRILSIAPPKPCDFDSSDDVEWHTTIELKLIAHPQLDPLQRKTIERDYKMNEGGELLVPIRLALAFYFIKRNNLDLRNGEIPAERAQLYLQNFDEVSAAVAQARHTSRALVATRRG